MVNNGSKSPLYSLKTIEFKRKEDSKWEKGLLFNDGDIILDSHGKYPDEVWDYKDAEIILESGLKFVGKLDLSNFFIKEE